MGSLRYETAYAETGTSEFLLDENQSRTMYIFKEFLIYSGVFASSFLIILLMAVIVCFQKCLLLGYLFVSNYCLIH